MKVFVLIIRIILLFDLAVVGIMIIKYFIIRRSEIKAELEKRKSIKLIKTRLLKVLIQNQKLMKKAFPKSVFYISEKDKEDWKNLLETNRNLIEKTREILK